MSSYRVLSCLSVGAVSRDIAHRLEVFGGPDSGINLWSFLPKRDSSEKNDFLSSKPIARCSF